MDNYFLNLALTLSENDISKVKITNKIVLTDAHIASHTHAASLFTLNKFFEDNQQAILAPANFEGFTKT